MFHRKKAEFVSTVSIVLKDELLHFDMLHFKYDMYKFNP